MSETTTELWPNSGFGLLEKDEAGRLKVTAGYSAGYFEWPEGFCRTDIGWRAV